MTPMLRSALAYAELGFAVFPLKPRGKVPAGGHGCKDATHEPDEIRALWIDPQCNVGIATGYGSDTLVLDVDGDEASENLSALERQHGLLPKTPTVETARGRHIYLRYPGPEVEIRNSAGMLGKGLDVRTDGGYVVAPPSVHPSGSIYRWLDGFSPREVALADMPEWLIAALVKRNPQPTNYQPAPVSVFGHTRYGETALEAECVDLARTGEGERNQRLNAVAFRVGQLVASGHLTERALSDVHGAGKAAGLEEREIRRTIHSGYTSGFKKPNPSDPRPDELRQRREESRAQPTAEPRQNEPEDKLAQISTVTALAVAESALAHLSDTSRVSMPRTGFRKIDQALGGMPPGTQITIGGRTGSGKSSLMLAIAMSQSERGIKFGIVSCEDPDWVWGARILCALNPSLSPDHFFGDDNGYVQPSVLQEARRGVELARDLGIHFSFQIGKSCEYVARAATKLVKQQGCRAIEVDYLQAIAARGKDRYVARTDDAQTLKQACYEAGVPLILGSQLKRPDGSNPFKEPVNGDLKDTGDLENMSEAIVLLWNESDEEDAPCFGKVSKVKWSPKRPRFELQRDASSGALVDLIGVVKKQQSKQGSNLRFPPYSQDPYDQ